MDNKPYDSAFKDIADQDAEALLRLIGAFPPGAMVHPLRPEISAPALATDQLYEVITATDHFITHLEAQARWVADVPERVAGYETILWVNKRLPIRTYVLVFVPDGMPANPANRCVIQAGDLTLISEFTIIKVWELPAEMALAQNNVNLLPFVPLMSGGGEQLERCAQMLGRVENVTRQRALSVHFVSMGSLRYNRMNLIQLLGRTTMQLDRLLRETPYIQEIMAETREETLKELREEVRKEAREELREEVRKEARKEAREEVREEVREEEQRQILVELLLGTINKRFPGLDFKAEVERVHDTDALKQMFIEFDRIPDADALRQRLAALAQTQQPQ